tara:strand:- start:126 stop:434 length:309 start_codon:yes stop_codon:yes gene_type:complete
MKSLMLSFKVKVTPSVVFTYVHFLFFGVLLLRGIVMSHVGVTDNTCFRLMASCFFFESRYTKPEGSLSLGVFAYDPTVKKVVEANRKDAAVTSNFRSFIPLL